MARVDWKAVCRVLEAVEPERTLEGFFNQSFEQLQTLVPFDHGSACNTHVSHLASAWYPGWRHYSAPPVFVVTERSMPFWSAYSLGDTPEDLPINHDPAQQLFRSLPRVLAVDWVRAAGPGDVGSLLARHRTRYGIDMCNAVDTGGWAFRISIHRGKQSPFNDRDCATLIALYPHFHNLYRVLTEPRDSARERTRRIAASAGLSKREVEVALLLSDGLSAVEIAEQLFISRHTVEKHLEHIYDKLRADGRRDARKLLKGDQPSLALEMPPRPR
jgi:DNA-binding CsgD family transcriptional regulator